MPTFAQGLNKVPEVTVSFWIIKVLCSSIGETGADFLGSSAYLGLNVARAATATLLVVALFWQLRKQHYTPWIYWLTVIFLSVVGAQIADLLTDELDVSLYVSTSVIAMTLAAIFALWYVLERSLSIYEICTRRRELFYWSVILCAFTLGTVGGDLVTEVLHLSFTWGTVGFGALIMATYLAWRLGGNAVLTFWVGYVLTGPFGAALGDLLTHAKNFGGLGMGTLWTSALFLSVIVILVASLQINFASSSTAAKDF